MLFIINLLFVFSIIGIVVSCILTIASFTFNMKKDALLGLISSIVCLGIIILINNSDIDLSLKYGEQITDYSMVTGKTLTSFSLDEYELNNSNSNNSNDINLGDVVKYTYVETMGHGRVIVGDIEVIKAAK